MTILHVYFEGCGHGQLHAIYSAVLSQFSASSSANAPDLLLIGGDFQALRTPSDIESLAVPSKYKKAALDGDFADYFNGTKIAPILTVFVGGNHEASNYLQELYYGGWVAPNIYYLGKSGSIIYKDVLRIAGLSGIYNKPHYTQAYDERVPFDNSTVRSVYHVRNYETAKLEMLGYSLKMVNKSGNELDQNVSTSLFKSISAEALLETSATASQNEDDDKNNNVFQNVAPPIDIFMSHDWPVGIEQFGNVGQLLKRKPFFKDDIQKGELGSPVNMRLLKLLKPKNWLSAHLHVGFTAEVDHNDLERASKNDDEKKKKELAIEKVENTDEIELDLEEEIGLDDDGDTQIETENVIKETENKKEVEESGQTKVTKETTKFVALDKCLPKRKFIEYIPIEVNTLPITDGEKNRNSSENLKTGSKGSKDSDKTVLGKKRQRQPSTSTDSNLFASQPQVSVLKYDPEWLAVVKTMNPYFPIKYAQKEKKEDVKEPEQKENIPDQDEKEKEKETEGESHPKLPTDYNGDLITSSLTTPQKNSEGHIQLSTLDQNRIWVRDNVVNKGLLGIPSYQYFFGNANGVERSGEHGKSNEKTKKHKDNKGNKMEDSNTDPSSTNTAAAASASTSKSDLSEFTNPQSAKLRNAGKVPIVDNPQTVWICNLLEMKNVVKELAEAELEQRPMKYQNKNYNYNNNNNQYNNGSRGYNQNQRGNYQNRGNNRRGRSNSNFPNNNNNNRNNGNGRNGEGQRVNDTLPASLPANPLHNQAGQYQSQSHNQNQQQGLTPVHHTQGNYFEKKDNSHVQKKSEQEHVPQYADSDSD